MDIAGVSSAAVSSTANNTNPKDAISVAVLDKALDVQAQSAAQLISSIPEAAPPQASTPDPDSKVGQNIDTYA